MRPLAKDETTIKDAVTDNVNPISKTMFPSLSTRICQESVIIDD